MSNSKEINNNVSRRAFLSNVALTGAALAVGKVVSGASFNQSTQHKNDMSDSITDKRKLGTLEVSALDFGCMNFVWAYGPGDR